MENEDKTRRGNGEGTIVQYKDGWRACVMVGRKENGQPNRKQLYGKTRAEVVKKLNEYKSQNYMGAVALDSKITLQKWFKTYLEEFRINDLRPSTIERYTGIYNNYIKNTNLGMSKLKDIKGTNIQAFYNSLLKQGKTPNTIKSLHKVLKTALNKALKEGYVIINYCNNVTLPKIKNKEEIQIFTQEEQKIFLAAIKKHRLKALFVLALGSGLREGEILGLKWPNLDLKNKTLTVSNTIKRVAIHNPKKGENKTIILEQDPKTNYSKRTIPIPSKVAEILIEHKNLQNKEKAYIGKGYVDNDYVFATELGGCVDPRNLARSYSRVLVNANIPHKKFHSLRHTFATRLFEKDVPLKTVSVLLGHANIKITGDIYTHVLKDQKIDAISKLDDLF